MTIKSKRTTLPKPATPDWWLMTKKFLAKGTSVASFAPSQGPLCRRILRGINFETAKCIVELGAGTGPVTVELLKQAKPHTRVVVIEIDADFCARLRQRFPAADIVEGDASKLEELLADRGIKKVDHVVSGLPIPSFPAPLRDAIIASSARVLAENGTFRQLTNMPWVYKPMYKRYFRDVSFEFVPMNLPPAGVYICQDYQIADQK
jgi:phospholipid N-methyltransferase